MACCTAPYYADCFVVMLIILALGEAISLPSRPSSLSIDLQKLFYTFWKKKLSFGPLLTRGLHNRFKLQKSLLISLVSKRTWRQSDLSTKALERTREPPHCISFGSVSASSSSSSSSGSSASTDSASAASVSTSLAFFFFFFPESGAIAKQILSHAWTKKKTKVAFRIWCESCQFQGTFLLRRLFWLSFLLNFFCWSFLLYTVLSLQLPRACTLLAGQKNCLYTLGMQNT